MYRYILMSFISSIRKRFSKSFSKSAEQTQEQKQEQLRQTQILFLENTLTNYAEIYEKEDIDQSNKINDKINELNKKISKINLNKRIELEKIAIELFMITMRAAMDGYINNQLSKHINLFNKLLASFETIYKKLYPTVEYKQDQINLMLDFKRIFDDSKKKQKQTDKYIDYVTGLLTESIFQFLYIEPVENKPEILPENKPKILPENKPEILVRNKYLKYKYKYLALKNNNNIQLLN